MLRSADGIMSVCLSPARTSLRTLSVSLRVLLHDTASSHSVLGQLGEKEKMRFPSNLLVDKTPDGARRAFHDARVGCPACPF